MERPNLEYFQPQVVDTHPYSRRGTIVHAVEELHAAVGCWISCAETGAGHPYLGEEARSVVEG